MAQAGRDSFIRFSEQARLVLALALGEAQRLQHRAVGGEHLPLGLLRAEDGVAAAALAGACGETVTVRYQVTSD